MASRRDVSVSSSDVDVVSFFQVKCGHRLRVFRIRDIHHLDAVVVADECVTELEFDIAWLVEPFAFRQHSDDPEVFVILNVDDHHPRVARNPGILTPDRDAACSVQNAVGVKDDVLLHEVVVRVSVEQRSGTDQEEAFETVRAIDECVTHRDGLFEVFRLVSSRGIRSHR